MCFSTVIDTTAAKCTLVFILINAYLYHRKCSYSNFCKHKVSSNVATEFSCIHVVHIASIESLINCIPWCYIMKVICIAAYYYKGIELTILLTSVRIKD